MKIHVLTPIYATTTLQEGVTPVVHYFTREWVRSEERRVGKECS